MKYIFILFLLSPLFTLSQELSNFQSIDSFILKVESNVGVFKIIYDTVSYEKADGMDYHDSLYIHREWFYKNKEVVKVLSWIRYGKSRTNMLGYYHNNKTIKFAEGEFPADMYQFAKFHFEIYYYNDREIKVSWLTPKPENVLSVASNAFLKWSYQLLKDAGKN